jgi:hypothetical protein
MAILCRLIALLAVMLMPLGMQPAAAAPAQHHASMAAQHCPEQAPTHDLKGGFSDCTMVCSAALPAADMQQVHPSMTCGPTEAVVARILHGLSPDTATPPPKRS